MVNEWRIGHKANAIPKKSIPRTSFMVWEKIKPLLFVSMYITNSNVAFIENFSSNPECSSKEIHDAFDHINNELDRVALALGIGVLWGFTASRGIVKMGIKRGYVKSDEAHVWLMKYVGGKNG